MKTDWPKDLTIWDEPSGRCCMSVPFTWLLPKAQRYIDGFGGDWLVGGPAVYLIPDYLRRCEVGREYPGVLQRVNPDATRTTVGCPNRCRFCGVRTICGPFRQLDVYPDRPIICDDNLLAASDRHVESVLHGLIPWGWCDFNQGLDAMLLKPWHAKLIAQIDKPMVRLALDGDDLRGRWADSVEMLITAGVAKKNICCYVLVGFRGDMASDVDRCQFVESFGIKALPMWFHRLDAMRYGEVNEDQEARGWTKEKQRKLMRHFYKHAGVL